MPSLQPLIDLLQRHPLRFCLAVALLLAAPTLSHAFLFDDVFHIMAAKAWLGEPVAPFFQRWEDHLGLPNMYRFFSGDVAENQEIKALGLVPWWVDEQLHITFWRPLASLLTTLDYRLFGLWAPGHHAHALLWYGGLIGAVHLVFRRTLAAAAPLALLLFAIDDTHILPVAWLANRNALIAGSLALLGLAAHLRWRQDGWRPGLPLSLLGLGAGLLGGEAALGVFGYLAAWQLFGERGPLKDRVKGMIPALLLGLAWALHYKWQHFGAFDSGLYLDPSSQPQLFLVAALTRGPALIAGQLASLPSDLWLFLPALRPLQIGAGVALAVLVTVLLRWIWPELPEQQRRALWWLVPGALLSGLPGLATFPLDRLLLLPGIGGAALVAVLLRHFWTSREQLRSRLLGAPLVLLHLVQPPLMWLAVGAFGYQLQFRVQETIEQTELPQDLDGREVLVLMASDPLVAIYLPTERALRSHPMPAAWHLGSMTPGDHRLSRVDARRLRLEALEQPMMQSPFEILFRGEVLPEDYQLQAAHHRVEVRREEDRVVALEFVFEEDLEDSPVWLMAWQEAGLVAVEAPAVGESVVLEASLGVMPL